ncbi:MAG TPA: MFS transporter [Steroidobacteraceae bacterium]|nr:MFS transporter [Steroidobacteraceae bacterium]
MAQSWRASTLAPFRSRTFLRIWSASIVSNFGSLIQAVGASWLMTSLAPSANYVALVQASTSLPIMLLALPSGAVADIWDRRKIMLIAQSAMFSVSVLLAVITYSGHIEPWSLLLLTFLLGCGTALYGPAWQSSVGEQVPREHIPAAVALNTMSYNLARTAGPAIGGLIVAIAGAPFAFAVNAMTYVGLIVTLATWKRPRTESHLPPESMLMAIRAGLRYCRLSPPIRAVLLRGFLLGALGSSIWALMPLIARDLLHGTAKTYGVLFGTFGCGAVIGALTSATARQRFTNETLARAGIIAFGLTAGVSAISPWMVPTLLAFLLGGASWVIMLTSFNITIQLSSPKWVTGRALAVYQMAVFGGMAIGSWMWGEIAEAYGLRTALAVSAVLLWASALVGLIARLPQTEGLNLAPSRGPMKFTPAIELGPESGRVIVTIEYRVAEKDQAAFAQAMRELQRIRRRDGARRWMLMQDLSDPEIWVERFHSPSWVEHQRRYHRFTVADQEIERRAHAFHRGDGPPRVRHLLERPPDELPIAEREAQALGERAVVSDPNLPSSAGST